MQRLLVANRGEIARRVFRTAHRMGLQTVAVYAEPDADAPFVREADIAVPLAGSTSAQTYLDMEQILAAARRSGADAVHPGYGFLAENAEFAERVIAAGLTWIGPPPAAMRAMALKVEAKRLARTAGVPLIQGAELPEGGDDGAAADAVGYPLMVKASAGGGGKGMRIVNEPQQLAEALVGARREAQASFGDSTVFLERYLPDARHVEVQVFADTHGQVVHLFERECSIQRRHQKIVEETPSPGLAPALAPLMYDAAVSLAEHIGYVGAGTVEFLVHGEGNRQEFYFLEMNTRLQVEHPVTECVTGLDLVEWQIRVAEGEPLPSTAITRTGHAIEVRLYAEDPAQDDLPSTGRVHAFAIPRDVRTDSGIESGSVITPYFDPMLAKVIAHEKDRTTAARVLARALRGSTVHGPVTNRDSLVAIVESPAFAAGDTTTAFLERHPHLRAPKVPDDVARRHLVSAALSVGDAQDGVAVGWRNVPAVPECYGYDAVNGSAAGQVLVHRARAATTVSWLPGEANPYAEAGWELGPAEFSEGALLLDGVRTPARVTTYDDERVVCIDDGVWSTQWRSRSRFPESEDAADARGPATAVPGTIVAVEVAVGDTVDQGQTLVVLEAMKMEHRITAAADAVVEQVLVQVGQAVDAHTVVVVLGDPA